MKCKTPLETITLLLDARGRGDADTAASCYETDAKLVAQPGTTVTGAKAIRKFLGDFRKLEARFTVNARSIIETDGVALHTCDWTLTGRDGSGAPVKFTGRSADILRKQADGTWLVAIDNPWAAAPIGQLELF